ncbi:hypothetical protein ACWGR3_31240, partial [Streptomyces albidoflavus]
MAFQALYDAIQTLRKRMGAAERAITNGVTATNGLDSRIDKAGEWAAKGGPEFINGAYRTGWFKNIDSGGSIDGHSDVGGFLIGETGYYEVEMHQRGGPSATPANDYVGIA